MQTLQNKVITLKNKVENQERNQISGINSWGIKKYQQCIAQGVW